MLPCFSLVPSSSSRCPCVGVLSEASFAGALLCSGLHAPDTFPARAPPPTSEEVLNDLPLCPSCVGDDGDDRRQHNHSISHFLMATMREDTIEYLRTEFEWTEDMFTCCTDRGEDGHTQALVLDRDVEMLLRQTSILRATTAKRSVRRSETSLHQTDASHSAGNHGAGQHESEANDHLTLMELLPPDMLDEVCDAIKKEFEWRGGQPQPPQQANQSAQGAEEQQADRRAEQKTEQKEERPKAAGKKRKRWRSPRQEAASTVNRPRKGAPHASKRSLRGRRSV